MKKLPILKVYLAAVLLAVLAEALLLTGCGRSASQVVAIETPAMPLTAMPSSAPDASGTEAYVSEPALTETPLPTEAAVTLSPAPTHEVFIPQSVEEAIAIYQITPPNILFWIVSPNSRASL